MNGTGTLEGYENLNNTLTFTIYQVGKVMFM